IMSWLKFFHPILEQLRETELCDGFITSINQTETRAMNAFIRPKLKRAHQPQYSLSRSYKLVSVHGFYPFLNPPNKNILVRHYQSSDKPKLIEYILSFGKRSDFVPHELMEDLESYI